MCSLTNPFHGYNIPTHPIMQMKAGQASDKTVLTGIGGKGGCWLDSRMSKQVADQRVVIIERAPQKRERRERPLLSWMHPQPWQHRTGSTSLWNTKAAISTGGIWRHIQKMRLRLKQFAKSGRGYFRQA